MDVDGPTEDAAPLELALLWTEFRLHPPLPHWWHSRHVRTAAMVATLASALARCVALVSFPGVIDLGPIVIAPAFVLTVAFALACPGLALVTLP